LRRLLKAQNAGPKGLPPGFVSADKGGSACLAELHWQKYLYLRP
jgi:uncharacterized protein